MKITPKDVDHVARLARLALSEDEKTRYAGQLESILGYIEKLNAWDTSNVVATSHVTSVSHAWREDKAEQTRLADASELVKQAPEQEGPFFKVKKVIE
jgi:aspartyl-tRNA(Asn)/glutamyl-tRNA(Gln) amidotransferase subunit C